MKKEIISSALFLFFFILAAHGQKEKDLIVTLENDTIYGEIFRPSNSLKKVQFREENGGKNKTYESTELISYKSDAGTFIACNIPTEGDQTEKVFMLNLVHGTANLYAFNANKYYIEKNSEFFLLEKNNRITNGQEIEDKRYAGTLKYLFNDCAGLEVNFDKLRFTPNDLINATFEYNSCRNPEQINKDIKKHSSFSINPRIYAGPSYSKITLTHSAVGEMESDGFEPGYTFGIDAMLGSTLFSNLNLIFGIAYTKKEGSSSRATSLDDLQKSIEATYLQPSIKFAYTFTGKKVSPIIFAGIAYGQTLQSEQIEKNTNRVTGDVTEKNIEISGNELKRTIPVAGGGLAFHFSDKFQPFFEYQYEGTKVEFITHKIVLGVKF